MQNQTIGLLVAGAALLAPSLALAWTEQAGFEARVHKHEFSRVTVTGAGCTLEARVFFDAPAEAYEDDSASRNYYRFQARIKLDSAHVVVTRIFHNDAPGAREYDYDEDTAGAGCWAKTASQARGVDVQGCRGRGCTPDPFM